MKDKQIEKMDLEEKSAKEEPLKEKRNLKPILGRTFRIISILFIIGCCIFYGTRLVKYYKIYNPKVVNVDNLFATELIKKSPFVYEGDGLYRLGGNYIYKGKEVNNYLEFSNLLWRIIKINSDNTIDLVLENPINYLAFDEKATNYKDSNIASYLNLYFLPILNKDFMQTTTVCLDETKEIKNTVCNTFDTTSYIRLLSINEFLNSITTDTYLNTTAYVWLTNYTSDTVWHTNGTNVSTSTSDNMYAIKPVITLKSTVSLIDGDGTKDNPYKIEEEKLILQVGDHISLGEDTWTIYEKRDGKLKLVSTELLPLTYLFSSTSSTFHPEEASSLANYLNHKYLESLSYKDTLVLSTWNTGLYEHDYKTVLESTVESYVGLYSVLDLKFETDLEGYTLLTPKDENTIYMMEQNGITTSSILLNRLVRPTISILETTIQSGDGSIENPYVLGGA